LRFRRDQLAIGGILVLWLILLYLHRKKIIIKI